MNKRSLLVFTVWMIAVLMVSTPVFGEKVTELEELINPQMISVGKDNLFVTEKTLVYIYSLKDFKLVQKFGKEGEGPGEFKRYAVVFPLKDELLVNSQGRVSYFSKQGKYIKEIKSQVGFIGGGAFAPVGKNFGGQGFTVENQKFYQTFNLFDSKLAKIKEVYRYQIVRSREKIDPLTVRLYRFACKSYKDRFYAANDADGIIKAFDAEGKEIMTVNYQFADLEVTKAHIKEMLEHYKINPDTKGVYERVKDRIEFPKYYPKFYDFFPGDNLYVLTYNRRDNKTEFIIFDKKGKFVKKTMVPFYQTNMHVTYPYNVYGNKLYQVVENEDDESWELHVNTIK